MSIEEELSDYVTNIEDIDMSSDYKLIKNYNFKENININDIKLDIHELQKDNEKLENKTYSKKSNK